MFVVQYIVADVILKDNEIDKEMEINHDMDGLVLDPV